MKKAKAPEDQIDGPAVITSDHLRNRTLSARAGSKKGWSRLTGYEKAHNKGQLMCREASRGAHNIDQQRHRADERFQAAQSFDRGWRNCQVPFPSGTDLDRVRGGGGVPGAFADHARDAKEFWRRVQAAMGANDWIICKMVCCDGYSVAEAVTLVSPAYKCTTMARFREALDGLIEGMNRAKASMKAECLLHHGRP